MGLAWILVTNVKLASSLCCLILMKFSRLRTWFPYEKEAPAEAVRLYSLGLNAHCVTMCHMLSCCHHVTYALHWSGMKASLKSRAIEKHLHAKNNEKHICMFYIGDICVNVSRFNTRKNIVCSAFLFVCEHSISGSQAAVGPKDTENSSFQNAISAVSFWKESMLKHAYQNVFLRIHPLSPNHLTQTYPDRACKIKMRLSWSLKLF